MDCVQMALSTAPSTVLCLGQGPIKHVASQSAVLSQSGEADLQLQRSFASLPEIALTVRRQQLKSAGEGKDVGSRGRTFVTA